MKKVIFGAIIAIAIAGCGGGGKSVDGKWAISGDGMDLPPGATATATFSGGKTLVLTMNMSQDLPDKSKMKIRADINATYTLTGDVMAVKAESAKFTIIEAPEALKSMMESQLKTQEEAIVKAMNDEQGNAKLAWVDDNTFTLTGKNGKPATFKRA